MKVSECFMVLADQRHNTMNRQMNAEVKNQKTIIPDYLKKAKTIKPARQLTNLANL
jgi:hypothetical protein